MKIKNAENNLDQVDSFLTKLKSVIKKHWGILLLITISLGIYWIFTTELEDNSESSEPHVIQEYYEVQENGDTLLIEVWSDGVETIAE